MCGIVGQVRSDARPVHRGLIESMCAGLEHRGPDSRGVHVEDRTGLGIQRLRVIDLATGDQPVFNEDGTICVVLNGEIYNYRELREGLSRRGHSFVTKGDTETIVHLYEEHGDRCVEHLHGMFAFALWDRRRQRLLIARDRLGKKPLFYSLRHGTLSFASEIGALLKDAEIPRDVDPTAIDGYLAYGYVAAPRSAFRAVRKLPPAHTLAWEGGRVALARYWQLDYSRKLTVSRPEELHEPILDAIRRATRRRMIADVPLGAFLSGGIDSSAVVAAMAEVSSQPVKTFSIGFDQGDFDELPYARRVAERFGTEHHELVARPDAVAVVPQLVRHYGEPFADSSAIPSFYLASLTRRHVTVALNGDGGDEAFAGYTRYLANRLAARLGRMPHGVRRALAASVGRLPAGGEVSSPINKARRLAGSLALDPAARYARYMSLWDSQARGALYLPGFGAEVEPDATGAVIAGPWAQASGADVLDIMLEVDTSTYLPDDLIAKIDIATMAHALEARSPFLDHQLMEFAATIPAGFKARGSEKKWILREALRAWLPDDLLDRPKQGFSVPMADWLRGDLAPMVRDVLFDPATRGRGYFREGAVEAAIRRLDGGADGEAPRVWSLLMLELWHREFVDVAAAGGVPVPVAA
jgi:asparagine synthase (glutamine-hydrolysing)